MESQLWDCCEGRQTTRVDLSPPLARGYSYPGNQPHFGHPSLPKKLATKIAINWKTLSGAMSLMVPNEGPRVQHLIAASPQQRTGRTILINDVERLLLAETVVVKLDPGQRAVPSQLVPVQRQR